MIRTGLLGGSFNPAHGGHRAISLFAIRALALDELWWLVTPGNPLKSEEGMAPLAARVASAQAMSGLAPIRVTAIEAELGTRYTVDTLAALKRRYANRHFIWLMGADNLATFHQWHRWRDIARQMPIAAIARPGYDEDALAGPAMGWFGRFVRPRNQVLNWTDWSTPALVILRFRPDPRSATAIRMADPQWYQRLDGHVVRDDVTRALIRNRESR